MISGNNLLFHFAKARILTLVTFQVNSLLEQPSLSMKVCRSLAVIVIIIVVGLVYGECSLW